MFRVAVNTLLFATIAANLLAAAGKAKEPKPANLLKAVSRTFDRLSQRSGDTVPDAVLNGTKCIVIIPRVSSELGSPVTRGVATCRQTPDGWEKPVLVSLQQDEVHSPAGDLLVFVLQDTAAHALRSGELRIHTPKSGSAPLVRTVPVPNQVELAADCLVYQYVPDVLSGFQVRGAVRLDNTAGKDAHVKDKINEQFLSSLESFFNTIMPTGIVVHHTAVLPGENGLPRDRSDVDEYHQTRGFEIKCFGRIYHMAYHYLILANGSIQTGRPERCEGAHAQGYNSYLGISVVGDFSSKDNPKGNKGPIRPSKQQIASLVQLCRQMQERYRIPLQRIVRHSDIASTKCPGDRFPFTSFLRQLQSAESGAPSSGFQ
ncbi:MAG: N-acetylmuramoyl-L-alanine amidase [Acidobacteria bacterium]|nr:N-acetylmuramoyl-L-alanine amidase [Acidobacteriota bacterium]